MSVDTQFKLSVSPAHSKTTGTRKEFHSMVVRADTVVNPECSHFAATVATRVHTLHMYSSIYFGATHMSIHRFAYNRQRVTTLPLIKRRVIKDGMPLTGTKQVFFYRKTISIVSYSRNRFL